MSDEILTRSQVWEIVRDEIHAQKVHAEAVAAEEKKHAENLAVLQQAEYGRVMKWSGERSRELIAEAFKK